MAACYGSYCNGKNFNNNISGDLVPNPEMWKKQHKLLLLKNCPLAYHHSHFLTATLDFTSVSKQPSLD